MKSMDDKTEFIRLRAEGKSYAKIGTELSISKSTCSVWERELKDQIADLKQERLNELFDLYHMTKKARIQHIGDILNKINDALAKVDLFSLSPEKLLDFQIKYTTLLKEEYIDTETAFQFSDNPDQNIEDALVDLLNRVRAGDITAEQADKEMLIIMELIKFENM